MKKSNRIVIIVLIFTLICSVAFSASTKVDENYLYHFYDFMQTLYYRDISTDDLVGGSFNGVLSETSIYSCYEQNQVNETFNSNVLGVSLEKVRTGLLVSNVYPGTNASKIGLETGDVIYRVNRISTSIMNIMDLDYVIEEAGSKAEIEVIKAETGSIVKLQCELSKGYISLIDFFIKDEFGYIRINQFKDLTSDEVGKALQFFDNNQIKNIIVDLRDLISMNIEEAGEVADFFLPFGRIASGGDMILSASIKSDYHFVNIIINEKTQGAGEVIARAVKNYRTGNVFGQTSYGLVEAVKTYPVFTDAAFSCYSKLAGTTDIDGIVNYINMNQLSLSNEYVSGYLHLVENELYDNNNISYEGGVTPDYILNASRVRLEINPQDNGIWIRKDYQLNDVSYDVFVAEKVLSQLGYFKQTPDVTFDINTQKAVNLYKASVNLPQDGILDMTTQNILNYNLFKTYIMKDECIVNVMNLIKEN
ncbi:MAG: peptidoglycan-binding protein [Clostridia bacterium]|nr:peptidoglycan-binding protein [Clostridia bacterium]